MSGWIGPSRRRLPRYKLNVPLDVTVLRSGIPDSVPGRSMNVCERGMGAVIAGELLPGESVGVEVRLSPTLETLRTRAMVRYQDQLRCGLEFVALSSEQRSVIRDWAKEAGMESGTRAVKTEDVSGAPKETRDRRPPGEPPLPGRGRKANRGWWWLVALAVIAAAAFSWWRWSHAWKELESGLKNSGAAVVEKPQAQVAAEVMQKLLVHRVEPTYPPEARKDNLQGIIALDIVVGRDGSVLNMRPLNGPDVLAHAAMDALQWWKFEPYRVNGEPVAVETTVAVEFKR